MEDQIAEVANQCGTPMNENLMRKRDENLNNGINVDTSIPTPNCKLSLGEAGRILLRKEIRSRFGKPAHMTGREFHNLSNQQLIQLAIDKGGWDMVYRIHLEHKEGLPLSDDHRQQILTIRNQREGQHLQGRKKKKKSTSSDPNAPVVKRGRGRPRKHPLPSTSVSEPTTVVIPSLAPSKKRKASYQNSRRVKRVKTEQELEDDAVSSYQEEEEEEEEQYSFKQEEEEEVKVEEESESEQDDEEEEEEKQEQKSILHHWSVPLVPVWKKETTTTNSSTCPVKPEPAAWTLNPPSIPLRPSLVAPVLSQRFMGEYSPLSCPVSSMRQAPYLVLPQFPSLSSSEFSPTHFLSQQPLSSSDFSPTHFLSQSSESLRSPVQEEDASPSSYLSFE